MLNASKSVIHVFAKSCDVISHLLNTKIIGNFVLYKMLSTSVYNETFYPSTTRQTYLQAYNILDMNVEGLVVLGVSMMYNNTVGYVDAIVSVMIAPDADHVNISICPGVSIRM